MCINKRPDAQPSNTSTLTGTFFDRLVNSSTREIFDSIGLMSSVSRVSLTFHPIQGELTSVVNRVIKPDIVKINNDMI